jgi:hypothetical protein
MNRTAHSNINRPYESISRKYVSYRTRIRQPRTLYEGGNREKGWDTQGGEGRAKLYVMKETWRQDKTKLEEESERQDQLPKCLEKSACM